MGKTRILILSYVATGQKKCTHYFGSHEVCFSYLNFNIDSVSQRIVNQPETYNILEFLEANMSVACFHLLICQSSVVVDFHPDNFESHCASEAELHLGWIWSFPSPSTLLRKLCVYYANGFVNVVSVNFFDSNLEFPHDSKVYRPQICMGNPSSLHFLDYLNLKMKEMQSLKLRELSTQRPE
jgi:hypothetical protein